MKTLIEIIHDAQILLALVPSVVIARGTPGTDLDGRSQTFQIRLRHDVDLGLSEYRCETRSWLGAQWSHWREQRGWLGGGGFDVRDVLATDWRIVS